MFKQKKKSLVPLTQSLSHPTSGLRVGNNSERTLWGSKQRREAGDRAFSTAGPWLRASPGGSGPGDVGYCSQEDTGGLLGTQTVVGR